VGSGAEETDDGSETSTGDEEENTGAGTKEDKDAGSED
jgi:hypothetical protein